MGRREVEEAEKLQSDGEIYMAKSNWTEDELDDLIAREPERDLVEEEQALLGFIPTPDHNALIQIACGTARCEFCLFWAPETRECRKEPPPRGSGQPFPQTSKETWCGAFIERSMFLPDAG